MTNSKTIFKQKSKLLLTLLCLLGLAFSYSCSCRNDTITGGGGNGENGGDGSDKKDNSDNPTWTFAPKLDLGNKYDISFTSDGSLKLAATVKFDEKEGHDIKNNIIIEEVKDPQSVLTKENIKHNGNDKGTITIAQSTLKSLADKLTSTEKPATNQVTIVFKLTSTNDASDENIKYITNTFNFIKAKKIDNSNIQGILRKGINFELSENAIPDKREVTFDFKNGEYIEIGKVYKIKNKSTDNYGGNIPKSEAKRYIGYNFDTALTNEGIYGVFKNDEGGTGKTYSLIYDITYGDLYEGSITPIKVTLENQSSSLSFVD